MDWKNLWETSFYYKLQGHQIKNCRKNITDEKGWYETHNLMSNEMKVLDASNEAKLFVASLSTSHLNNNNEIG